MVYFPVSFSSIIETRMRYSKYKTLRVGPFMRYFLSPEVECLLPRKNSGNSDPEESSSVLTAAAWR